MLLPNLLLQTVVAGTPAGDAPALTAAQQPVADSMNLLDMAVKGGWIMIVLAVLSVICIYIFFERLYVIRKAGKEDPRFIERIKDYIQMIKTPRHFPSVRKELAALLAGYFLKAPVMAAFNRKNGSLYKEIADFQPGFAPRRGQVHCGRLAENPLVSVVVRTHRRKEVLRRTLSCLYNQTYKNFEVIVVEDGQDTAGEMVK